MNWEWSAVDWMLLGPGIGLWLCSQSINDFKRLLPLWVRAMLGMQMTPKDVADMSESAVSRRAFTLFWQVFSLELLLGDSAPLNMALRIAPESRLSMWLEFLHLPSSALD